jgi:hypothetical protein
MPDLTGADLVAHGPAILAYALMGLSVNGLVEMSAGSVLGGCFSH